MNYFDFDEDVNGYYFSYFGFNIIQMIARHTGINSIKLHNIILKHNGNIRSCGKSSSTYRFDTKEECKKAAEEFAGLIIMKKLVE